MKYIVYYLPLDNLSDIIFSDLKVYNSNRMNGVYLNGNPSTDFTSIQYFNYTFGELRNWYAFSVEKPKLIGLLYGV